MSGVGPIVRQDHPARKYWGCVVPGCDGDHYAKGYCSKHWHRMRRNGHLNPMPSGKASPNYGRNRAAMSDVA